MVQARVVAACTQAGIGSSALTSFMAHLGCPFNADKSKHANVHAAVQITLYTGVVTHQNPKQLLSSVLTTAPCMH